jgi:hypothetical protein
LGVPTLEHVLAETMFVDHLINDTQTVAGIAERLAVKVDRYLAALGRLATAFSDGLAALGSDGRPVGTACCSTAGAPLHPAQWRPSRAFGGLTVNRAATCELWPSSHYSEKDSWLRQIEGVIIIFD